LLDRSLTIGGASNEDFPARKTAAPGHNPMNCSGYHRDRDRIGIGIKPHNCSEYRAIYPIYTYIRLAAPRSAWIGFGLRLAAWDTSRTIVRVNPQVSAAPWEKISPWRQPGCVVISRTIVRVFPGSSLRPWQQNAFVQQPAFVVITRTIARVLLVAAAAAGELST